MSHKPIWPGVQIPVLGVTGKYSSGKSLFIASIDPKRSILFDFEKSLNSYTGFGFKHVDFSSDCLATFGSGYTPLQAFKLFVDHIRGIDPGKYTVIGVDPISDIESGMVTWVKSRYNEFGFNSMEKFASTGGIFWETVKSEWKRLLAELTSKCQTFAFTTHLRNKWVNGRPTNIEEPKGKSTLMELASLSLFLERDANQQVPSARVLKTRVAVTRFNEETQEPQLIGVLPPHLDKATPKRIREYILNPPDWDNLLETEKEHEKVLSDAERLQIEQEIALSKLAAQEAELETAKLQAARIAALPELTPPPEAPADEGSSGRAQDAQTPVSFQSDSWPSAWARDNLFSGLDDNGIRVLARKVYGILQARGADVSGFKTPDAAKQYAKLLTEEEILSLKV